MPENTHATTAPAGHAEEGNSLLRPDPGLAIWTVVTFVLLLVILKKLAWGPMLETLDKREKAIREALLEAEKARLAAASSVEEQNRILMEARREAQEFLTRNRADAERAREELLARAKSESEKIVAAGRQAVEEEKRAAIVEIRATAVDLALAASSKLLRAQIDDTRNRELVNTYVKELEASKGSQRA